MTTLLNRAMPYQHHWVTRFFVSSLTVLLLSYCSSNVFALWPSDNLRSLASFTRTSIRAFSITLFDRTMNNEVGWRNALKELPSTPNKIPAFFFAHGSPMLAFQESARSDPMMSYQGPGGSLATFLKEFGPVLLQKYKPKGIVVFSAHWETLGERLGLRSLSSVSSARG